MRHLLAMAVFTLFLAAGSLAASGQDMAGNPASGRAFAQQTCTPCHVVSPSQSSPGRSSRAPSFQAIANAPGMTASSLRAFLATPHPTMPNLILSRQETVDVIAYILSLREKH